MHARKVACMLGKLRACSESCMHAWKVACMLGKLHALIKCAEQLPYTGGWGQSNEVRQWLLEVGEAGRVDGGGG